MKIVEPSWLVARRLLRDLLRLGRPIRRMALELSTHARGIAPLLGKRRKLPWQWKPVVLERNRVRRLGGKKYLNLIRGRQNLIANPRNLHLVQAILKDQPCLAP